MIGSNTTEQHPVFGTMLRRAVAKRGLKIVVADPRKIDLSEFASLHLRQRSGTDIALLNGLMYIILEKGWEDKEFAAERCEGRLRRQESAEAIVYQLGEVNPLGRAEQ